MARLCRKAHTPQFDLVSFQQNEEDLDATCHDLLVGDWTLFNVMPNSDEKTGTIGFLAVDRDIHKEGEPYNVYLCEVFQFNKDDEKGRVECGVLVYELTPQDTAGQLVFSGKKSGKVQTVISGMDGEIELSDKLHVIRLSATTYAEAKKQADDWFAAHLPPSKRDAQQYPRLTRVAWR